MAEVYNLEAHYLSKKNVNKKEPNFKYGDKGGGKDMSKYVTKEEFNSVTKDLSHQMELYQEKTLSNFDLLSQKLDNISASIPDKVEISLNAKKEEERKSVIETRRYILGTIVLGIISILISLIK